MSRQPDERVVIITVHGTNDTATAPSGDKWFQEGSAFVGRLKHQLASHGMAVDVDPFLWSGANSVRAREVAAEALAHKIKTLERTCSEIHLVSHSHGGNVAVDAACTLNWPRTKRGKKITSITTVGTPFLQSTLSRWAAVGGLAFLGFATASVLALAVMAIFLWQRSPENPNSRLALVFAAISAVAFLFTLPMAWSGARRIRRIGRKKNEDAIVHSIWHTNDEAINFLQRVHRLQLQPFPKGSLWRGSRTAAVVWGVRIAFLFWSLATLYWIYTGLRGGDLGPGFWLGLLIPVGLVPLTFSIAYILVRVIGGLVPEVALRGQLNRSIGGILVGMAFGRDGDEQVGDVSTSSHYFGSTPIILQGEVADRMQASTEVAANKLIEKYRWTLFSPEADSNAMVKELTADTLTWDSLIHTTYFDQPEIADMIGDYVASRHANGDEP